jgi:hypothetical protein
MGTIIRIAELVCFLLFKRTVQSDHLSGQVEVRVPAHRVVLGICSPYFTDASENLASLNKLGVAVSPPQHGFELTSLTLRMIALDPGPGEVPLFRNPAAF